MNSQFPKFAERLTGQHWDRQCSLSKLLILLSGTIISVFLTLSDNIHSTHGLLKGSLYLQLLSLGVGLLYCFLDSRVPLSQLRQLKNKLADPTRDRNTSIPVTQSTRLYNAQITAYTSQLATFGGSYLCLFLYLLLGHDPIKT